MRDSCNICRYSFIANDVKSVVVDLLEGNSNFSFHSFAFHLNPLVIAGGERLQENRYLRLHIYRCHWCAPIDAHYNTAKQLSQHVRSKHYRLLQALLATQANMLQNNSATNPHQTRGKRARDYEQDENGQSNLTSSFNPDRYRQSPNALYSSTHHDSSPRLPIPIGLPESLTGQSLSTLIHSLFSRISRS